MGFEGAEGSGPLLEHSNLLQSKFIENMLRTPTPRQTKLSLGPPPHPPAKQIYLDPLMLLVLTANICTRLYSVTANYAVAFVSESVFVF